MRSAKRDRYLQSGVYEEGFRQNYKSRDIADGAEIVEVEAHRGSFFF